MKKSKVILGLLTTLASIYLIGVNSDKSNRRFETRTSGSSGRNDPDVDFDPVSDLEDDQFRSGSSSRSRNGFSSSSSKIKNDYSALSKLTFDDIDTRSRSSTNNNNNDRGIAGTNNAGESSEADRTGCPPEFNGRCECKTIPETNRMNRVHEKIESKFVVNCTNTGFTDPTILSYLPYFTDELIFVGNKIPTIPPNLFGKGNDYPNLKKIDLSENEITTIDGKAFHHVGNVKTLILNHNNLSNDSLHEHPRVFSNFYNLKELYLTNAFNDKIWNLADLYEIFVESNLTQVVKIHLEQNELEFIFKKDFFCSLPSLTQIYLAQNNLSDLNINIKCLNFIQVIDLRQNNIRTINEDSALWSLLGQNNTLGEPIRIELLGNKINCDCNSQSFINWLKNAQLKDPDRVRDLEQLKCYDGLPKSNQGIFVRAIDQTECPILTTSYESYSKLASGLSWILILIIIVVFISIVYFNRTFIYRFINVRPCLIPMVGSHAAYTSIDKNEEAEVAHV